MSEPNHKAIANNNARVIEDFQKVLQVRNERIEALESRWNKLKDIFQLTIDNYEDLHELDEDVLCARSVLDEINKLEGEG